MTIDSFWSQCQSRHPKPPKTSIDIWCVPFTILHRFPHAKIEIISQFRFSAFCGRQKDPIVCEAVNPVISNFSVRAITPTEVEEGRKWSLVLVSTRDHCLAILHCNCPFAFFFPLTYPSNSRFFQWSFHLLETVFFLFFYVYFFAVESIASVGSSLFTHQKSRLTMVSRCQPTRGWSAFPINGQIGWPLFLSLSLSLLCLWFIDYSA